MYLKANNYITPLLFVVKPINELYLKKGQTLYLILNLGRSD